MNGYYFLQPFVKEEILEILLSSLVRRQKLHESIIQTRFTEQSTDHSDIFDGFSS